MEPAASPRARPAERSIHKRQQPAKHRSQILHRIKIICTWEHECRNAQASHLGFSHIWPLQLASNLGAAQVALVSIHCDRRYMHRLPSQPAPTYPLNSLGGQATVRAPLPSKSKKIQIDSCMVQLIGLC